MFENNRNCQSVHGAKTAANYQNAASQSECNHTHKHTSSCKKMTITLHWSEEVQ